MRLGNAIAVCLACELLAGARPARSDEGPLRALPYSPSLDPAAMDPRAAPCSDFYQYACGGWMKQNPIPADQSSWSVYGKLQQENLRFLRGILEDLAQARLERTPDQQKIGDAYAACMDEAAIDRKGMTPIQPWLSAIGALGSIRELAPLVARLQLAHLGFYDDQFLFGFGSEQNLEDSSQMVAVAQAGGLGLPDRDYYTRDDAKSERQRQQYRAHVTHMLGLLGDAPAAAAREADGILAPRDRAGQGLTHAGAEARPAQHLPRDDPGAAAAADAVVRLAVLPGRVGAGGAGHPQRRGAGLRAGARAGAPARAARRLAELPALAPRERRGGVPLHAVRAGELRLLQAHAARRAGAAPALEALRLAGSTSSSARRSDGSSCAGPSPRTRSSAPSRWSGRSSTRWRRSCAASTGWDPARGSRRSKSSTPSPTRSATPITGATTGRCAIARDDFAGNVERALTFESQRWTEEGGQAGRPRPSGT